MTETEEQRGQRQFKNYQWRHGRDQRYSDATAWTVPYRSQIIMEQALDNRSQFEWFANPIAHNSIAHQERA